MTTLDINEAGGGGRLAAFIRGMTLLVGEQGLQEEQVLATGGKLLGELVAQDDWLPEAFTVPHPQYYMQYLLHCDPLERFSVVSFVWGPGQKTPIHNHSTWGLIGMLRGAEIGERFEPGPPLRSLGSERLEAGMVDAVSPRIGDVHQVRNAYEDKVSISVHAYGGNIGRISRHVFDPASGQPKGFISGYGNAVLPNPWRIGAPA